MSALRTWLEEIGLGQYADQLEAAAIDFDVLPDLNEEHLRQLGLPLGHQLKLLRAAKAIGQPALRPTAESTAAGQDSLHRAERRQLTVMFCDLVGSTALSQSMDPEALRELMRGYQEACRGVVARYGGHVAQYLGDGMMVYFGWPAAQEDDAERCLRAGLDIITDIKVISAPTPLLVRIGIATGTVVVGDTAGSDVGAARLAVGETPNLASRLQSIAGADEIIMSAGTHRLVGARFDVVDLGAHVLKGIIEPVHSFKVMAVSQAEGRFEARHYDNANLPQLAISLYRQAGQAANRRSANREALRYYERILGLLAPVSFDPAASRLQIEALVEIGTIYMLLEGWASERALDYYSKAERHSADTIDDESRFRCLVGLCTTLTWHGRARDTKDFAQEVMQRALASRERIENVFALQVVGQNDMYEGRFQTGIDQLAKAVELYDENLDKHAAFAFGYDPGVTALWFKAYMLAFVGALDQALDIMEQALRIARRIGHEFSLAAGLAYYVDLSSLMSRQDLSKKYILEGIEVAERQGFVQLYAMCCIHLGTQMADSGDADKGMDLAVRSLKSYYDTGAAIIAPRLTATVASAMGRIGKATEGLELLQNSPDRRPGTRKVQFTDISRTEGELHLQKSVPDPELAEAFFQEAVRIGIGDGNKLGRLRAAICLARLWQTQGKAEQAIGLLRPLYDSFTEGFNFPDLLAANALIEGLG